MLLSYRKTTDYSRLHVSKRSVNVHVLFTTGAKKGMVWIFLTCNPINQNGTGPQ